MSVGDGAQAGSGPREPVSLDPLAAEVLQKLYRNATRDPQRIRRILEGAFSRGSWFEAGCNRLTQARSVRIAAMEEDSLILETRHFGGFLPPQIPLTLELEGRRWFLLAVPLQDLGERKIRVRAPTIVYEPERRDLTRSSPATARRAPERIELRSNTGERWQARVVDWSHHGMGVEVPEGREPTGRLEVHGDSDVRIRRYAWVRHRSPGSGPGWIRLGLQTSEVPSRSRVPLERRADLRPLRKREPVARRFARRVRGGATQSLSAIFASGERSEIPIAEFRNARGERLRAIVDRIGDGPGGPLVLIPPAWGRTKETVAPLALTILESFRALDLPVTVLRFDGTRRRGESFNDPECLRPGDEYLHFTFSGAVDDIDAALHFAAMEESLRPGSVVVVSSSLASIEARRALARTRVPRIDGWVSLVGLVDLHRVLRAVSGGVDYGLGALRNVRFGIQDLFGVRCDIDRIVSDAIDNRLWFLEDARSDLAQIHTPITWFHGGHDAWTSLEDVRDVLGCGDVRERRLIEIPVGHQLRNSAQALEVFQLITAEIGRLLTGTTLPTRAPDRRALLSRERAERRRLPLPYFDLRRFWREYLVGRNGEIGMELLTSGEGYRNLMATQVAALDLKDGDLVADLGSGVGDFAVFLRDPDHAQLCVRIHAFDYVPEALVRQRERMGPEGSRSAVGLTLADLGVGRGLSLPIRAGTYDALLAALLLTYLEQPEALLAEAFRVLKPGGRLVVSGMRPDADVSRLYADSLRELSPERLEELFGRGVAQNAPRLRRWFLSDASRILDLEEFGYFHFWDADELARMVGRAGFHGIETLRAFGDPPQAVIVRATRPL